MNNDLLEKLNKRIEVVCSRKEKKYIRNTNDIKALSLQLDTRDVEKMRIITNETGLCKAQIITNAIKLFIERTNGIFDEDI